MTSQVSPRKESEMKKAGAFRERVLIVSVTWLMHTHHLDPPSS